MAAAVLATMTLPACDSGGGSPTAPASPGPARGVSFSPATPSGAAIALRGNASGASLEIEVYAVGVDDLYGLSFELRFPGGPAALRESWRGGLPRSGGEGNGSGPTPRGRHPPWTGCRSVGRWRHRRRPVYRHSQRQRPVRLQRRGGLRQFRRPAGPELARGNGLDRPLMPTSEAASSPSGPWSTRVATVAPSRRTPPGCR